MRVAEISGLDVSDPSAQVFTLFYRALSDKKSVVKFVIEDNFHQHRELVISFSNDTQRRNSQVRLNLLYKKRREDPSLFLCFLGRVHAGSIFDAMRDYVAR